MVLDITNQGIGGDSRELLVILDNTKSRLESIFNTRFNPPYTSYMEYFYSWAFHDIFESIQNEQFVKARAKLAFPLRLIQCLETIKEYDQEIQSGFIEDLEQANYDKFHGVRCEIDTAQSLLTKGIAFKHPDPPDFVLKYNDQAIGVECTSAHIDTADNLRQKLFDRIEEKDSKWYAGPNTIVFLEISNPLFELGDQLDAGFQEMKEWIGEDMGLFGQRMGSVVLFQYVFHRKQLRLHHIYHRVDNINIGVGLKEFLDEHYEIKDIEFNQANLMFPREL